jgi:hypothetical protein
MEFKMNNVNLIRKDDSHFLKYLLQLRHILIFSSVLTILYNLMMILLINYKKNCNLLIS